MLFGTPLTRSRARARFDDWARWEKTYNSYVIRPILLLGFSIDIFFRARAPDWLILIARRQWTLEKLIFIKYNLISDRWPADANGILLYIRRSELYWVFKMSSMMWITSKEIEMMLQYCGTIVYFHLKKIRTRTRLFRENNSDAFTFELVRHSSNQCRNSSTWL